VKDSHDRFANVEINYLLKRIEEYVGLAILVSGNRTKSTARSRVGFISLSPSAYEEKRAAPGNDS
jgi:hypothetical protein